MILFKTLTILTKFLVLCPQMSFQLCCQVVELEIQREGNKPWGLRIVGGADVATVMKVSPYHISGYIWDQLCHPGWEGSWDWHSSSQGRPEGRGCVGGSWGGADHHDDPPPGHAYLLRLFANYADEIISSNICIMKLLRYQVYGQMYRWYKLVTYASTTTKLCCTVIYEPNWIRATPNCFVNK